MGALLTGLMFWRRHKSSRRAIRRVSPTRSRSDADSRRDDFTRELRFIQPIESRIQRAEKIVIRVAGLFLPKGFVTGGTGIIHSPAANTSSRSAQEVEEKRLALIEENEWVRRMREKAETSGAVIPT